MSVSVLHRRRNNSQYRYIFVVHNEYRKGVRSVASLSDAGTGNKLVRVMASLWNRVPDLGDGRIIGVAKPQRRRLAIGSADSIEPAVSRTTRIVAAEANMRTTQSAWAIAYSGLVTTVIQQAWRESAFVAVRLSTVTV